MAATAAMWRARRRRAASHATHRPGRGAAAIALALGGCCLVLAGSGLQAWLREAGQITQWAQQGATVELEASVVGDPKPLPGRPGRGPTVLVELRVHVVQARGERSIVAARVLAFADATWRGVRWGETVRATGRLAPSGRADDVVATFASRGAPRVLSPAGVVHRVADRLRAGLRRACAGLPADARGLLPGLVVGDTSRLPPDLDDTMKATGLTHLSAVSGTNTTLVCALALAMGRGVGLGRRLRVALAALVLAAFVVLARPEPSVLRAALMGALGLLAMGTARRRAALPALCAAVLGLLVVNPWLSRSYGFALSVLATAGLLLLARPWSAAMARRLPAPLAVAIAVPLAAQAMCGPLIVQLSGQVSLVSLPANIIAEPCVAPATVFGLAAALASLVSPGLATALAWLGAVPCLVIASTARWLARMPGGQVAWPAGAAGVAALVLITAALALAGPVVWRWSRRGPAARAQVLVLGSIAVLAAATTISPLGRGASWPPPGWVMVACDVGQGDALVLSTGPHRAVLVDAGPDPAAVDRCLRALDVRTLDEILLTHFHEDHVAGLAGALRGRRVGSIVVTIIDDPPQQARRVRALAAAARIPVRTVVDGRRVVDNSVPVADSVRWQVLWPERVVRDGSVPNNASIVLFVQSHGLRLLLLGDVEPAAARLVALRVARLPGGPRVDVMKVAHHGSALQDADLLAETHPRLALISVGADNDYGHPAPSLLRRLTGQAAVVARTDRQGDLAVSHVGGSLTLSTSGPHRTAVGGRR